MTVETYQDRLIVARGAHDRDAAINFRAESRLVWARFAEDLVAEFEKSSVPPSFRKAQNSLKDHLELVSDPQLGRDIIRTLVDRGRDAQIFLQLIYFRHLQPDHKAKPPSEWTTQDRRKVGRVVFQLTTGDRPEGTVEVLPSSLALGLSTFNENDYFKLTPRHPDSGGFFREQKMQIANRKLHFSLIVLHDDTRPASSGLKHEEQHAVNDVILEVLKKHHRLESIWGGEENEVFLDQPITTLEEFKAYASKHMVPQALYRAKDEIIAKLATSKGTQKLEILLEREGLYDYLSNHIRSLKEHSLLTVSDEELQEYLDDLWGSYANFIEKTIKEIEPFAIYRGLELPFFLAQIPLQNWETITEKDSQLPIVPKIANNLEQAISEAKKFHMQIYFALRIIRENIFPELWQDDLPLKRYPTMRKIKKLFDDLSRTASPFQWTLHRYRNSPEYYYRSEAEHRWPTPSEIQHIRDTSLQVQVSLRELAGEILCSQIQEMITEDDLASYSNSLLQYGYAKAYRNRIKEYLG